jgi:hypothetical protein
MEKNKAIDSKILEMACKDYLLAAVTNSASLRKKLTFAEQVKLTEHVMSMSYKDLVSVLFYEGKNITTEKITDFEGKTKKALKYGAAGFVGRKIGKTAIGGAPLKALGFTLKKGSGVADRMTHGGTKGGFLGALGGVGLFYLYRKLTDPCVRASLSIKNIGHRKLAKHECQAAAAKKVISTISSDLSKCAESSNPEKCRRKLQSEIMKWRKRYQKELIEISKLKSKEGNKG